MKIGIIVATEEERRPFYKVFGAPSVEYPYTNGYEVARWEQHNSSIYLIQSSFGEIAAASATQYLIDKFEVEKLINYGAVGGLSYGYYVGRIGFVREVVHYGFAVSVNGRYAVGEYPHKGVYLRPYKDAIPNDILKEYGLSRLICASADKFVGSGEPKRKLRKDFGADICDMEAAGIIITCNRNEIPVTSIKAVSDNVSEDTKAFKENVFDVSLKCVNLIYNVLNDHHAIF